MVVVQTGVFFPTPIAISCVGLDSCYHFNYNLQTQSKAIALCFLMHVTSSHILITTIYQNAGIKLSNKAFMNTCVDNLLLFYIPSC